MTALNLYMGNEEVHFFTDGGNYSLKTLEFKYLGGKIWPLPAYNAALAWSGPSNLIAQLIPRIDGLRAPNLRVLLALLPTVCVGLTLDPLSIVVAGVFEGRSYGIAFEEGGRLHWLESGNFVKSINTSKEFDPSDVVTSGIDMMEDQRSSGVVHGYCLHTKIVSGELVSKIVRRW